MTIVNALPFTLTNGTSADATQVQADLNQIVSDVNTNAAHNGANSDITALTGITSPFAYAVGGSGTNTSTPFTPWAVAGGTADAITATYSPANGSLFDGLSLAFRATAANATTTPTFSPDGFPAHTITKQGGTALVAGDIPAALAECIIRYNSAHTRWELYDPAPSAVVSSIADATNGGMHFSASTGAVTANIAPGDLTSKGSPVGADLIVIGDSAASNAPKTATITSVLAISPVVNDMLLYQNQQSASTTGPTFTNNSWQTMPITTEVIDTGNCGTLSANAVTLIAGSYEFWAEANLGIQATGGETVRAKLRLRNTTDSTTTIIGDTVSCLDHTAAVPRIVGSFTIAGSKTFEIQGIPVTSNAASTSACPAIGTDTEVYLSFKLRRFA